MKNFKDKLKNVIAGITTTGVGVYAALRSVVMLLVYANEGPLAFTTFAALGQVIPQIAVIAGGLVVASCGIKAITNSSRIVSKDDKELIENIKNHGDNNGKDNDKQKERDNKSDIDNLREQFPDQKNTSQMKNNDKTAAQKDKINDEEIDI